MRKVEDRICESGSIKSTIPMNGRNRLWFQSFLLSAILFEIPATNLSNPDISHQFRKALSGAVSKLAIIASTGGGCQDSVSLQAGPE